MEKQLLSILKTPFKSENENFEFNFKFSTPNTGTLTVTFLSDGVTTPFPFIIFEEGEKDYITIEHIVIVDNGKIEYQIIKKPLSEVIDRFMNDLIDIRPKNV